MGARGGQADVLGWEFQMATAVLALAFEILGSSHILASVTQLMRNLTLASGVWCGIDTVQL
jgi:hypothetical protein